MTRQPSRKISKRLQTKGARRPLRALSSSQQSKKPQSKKLLPRAKTQVQREQTKHPKPTKHGAMLALLRRSKGASLVALMKATGWQAHSVRGYLAGTLKKKCGLSISSKKVDGVRVYRIDTRRLASKTEPANRQGV